MLQSQTFSLYTFSIESDYWLCIIIDFPKRNSRIQALVWVLFYFIQCIAQLSPFKPIVFDNPSIFSRCITLDSFYSAELR